MNKLFNEILALKCMKKIIAYLCIISLLFGLMLQPSFGADQTEDTTERVDFASLMESVTNEAPLYCSHLGAHYAVLELASGASDGGYIFCLDDSYSMLIEDQIEYFNFPSFISVATNPGGQFVLNTKNAEVGESDYISYINGNTCYKMKVVIVKGESSINSDYSFDYVPSEAEIKNETQLYYTHVKDIRYSELELAAGTSDGGYKFYLDDTSDENIKSGFEFFSFPSFISVTPNSGGQFVLDASNAEIGDTGYITYFDSGTYYKMSVKIVDEVGKTVPVFGEEYESFYPAESEIKSEAKLYIKIGKTFGTRATSAIDAPGSGYKFYTAPSDDAVIDQDMSGFYFPYFVKASLSNIGQFKIDAQGALLYSTGYITYFKDGVLYKCELMANCRKELIKDLTVEEKLALMKKNQAISAKGEEENIARLRGEIAAQKEEETVTTSVSFSDVKSTDYFSDAVSWAFTNSITAGTDSTHFSPTYQCSKSQLITFLYRAAGSPSVETSEELSQYKDMSQDWYKDSISWACENNIADAVSNNNFGVDSKISRAEFVTYLWKANGSPKTNLTDNPFDDVNESDETADAILWAYENGVTAGTSDTTFSPDDYVNRGQVVTFLYRYYDN